MVGYVLIMCPKRDSVRREITKNAYYPVYLYKNFIPRIKESDPRIITFLYMIIFVNNLISERLGSSRHILS